MADRGDTAGASITELLRDNPVTFFMEAHNGLSARIAQEAGFQGIWASGLTISASYGVRDANEISWTQVLGVVESMTDAAGVPVLVDGDTGYGNFNNVRRLVKKLRMVGARGVCIEDKLFPKRNSFARGHQELEEAAVFAGKIQAAKDACGEAFTVVARVESLIAGCPMDEAVDRACAYAAAGADALFIHSKQRHAGEILEFMGRFAEPIPVIVAPTTYYSTPAEELAQSGVRGIIWANHALRASVTAIRNTVQEIARVSSVFGVEPSLASIAELFRLVDQEELERATERYSWVEAPLAQAGRVSVPGVSPVPVPR